MNLFRIGLSCSKFGLINTHSCNHRMVIRSLTLANPMFAYHKKIPDLPEEPPPPPDSKDFLSQHGGKVALAGFSIAGALIYRWLQGSKNKRELEHNIANTSPLHPYESNDLREKNTMTVTQYKQFVNDCVSNFPSGFASYKEFLRLLHTTINYHIADGYVLDRLVLFYVETQMNTIATIEDDLNLPVVFLLVLLSNVVTSTPNERAEMLFDVSRSYFQSNHTTETGHGNSTPEDELYCSVAQAEMLVEQLDKSWQARCLTLDFVAT